MPRWIEKNTTIVWLLFSTLPPAASSWERGFVHYLYLPGLCYLKIDVAKNPPAWHKKLLSEVTRSGTGSAKKKNRKIVKLIVDVKTYITCL